MSIFFKIVVFLLLVSCRSSPSDQIIDYAKEKYGKGFIEGNIDLKDIFQFQWEKLYIFSPLTYPKDIVAEIGFDYEGEIVPDNYYLFLFVQGNKMVKKHLYSNIKIGFNDNGNNGVYKIDQNNAAYKIVLLNEGNYWLYKQ